MFSIFGFVDKVDFDGAFDAYCDGAEILFQLKGFSLEDENNPVLARVSKKIVIMRGEREIFRFPRFVKQLKAAVDYDLDFYVLKKRKRLA